MSVSDGLVGAVVGGGCPERASKPAGLQSQLTGLCIACHYASEFVLERKGL